MIHHGKMEEEEITGLWSFFRLPISDSELESGCTVAEGESIFKLLG